MAAPGSFHCATESMMSMISKHLPLLAVLALLGACQSFEDGDRQLARQGQQLLDESLQQALASPPPAEVQAALLPPLRLDLPNSAGPRFDVAVSEMPAREFFLSLMQGAGQNLVVHPQVDGLVTFSLRNVTLEEALSAVRDSYGYDFRRHQLRLPDPAQPGDHPHLRHQLPQPAAPGHYRHRGQFRPGDHQRQQRQQQAAPLPTVPRRPSMPASC